MTTIYLIRHGETNENVAHILQGHMQGTLSAQGISQAEELARRLGNVRFDALVCSDLQRCVDTAKILNRTHQLPIQTTPLLRERDWGSFTGRVIAEIQNSPFPLDVESVDDMLVRAATVVHELSILYSSQTVLVVSHGLFCRAIQAVHFKQTLSEIKPMKNAECRILYL